MIFKQIYIRSFVFSAISGIVNVFCILHFGLVVTNITGYFSELVQTSHSNTSRVLGFIFCYIIGAFVTFSCLLIAHNINKNWIRALPLIMNLFIFLWLLMFPDFPIYLLFIAMSSQNAFGTTISNGHIRPSQITGISISLSDDLAHYLFRNKTNKRELNIKFLAKISNMLGFLAGGSLAIFYQKPQILWVVASFYLIASLFILKRKKH